MADALRAAGAGEAELVTITTSGDEGFSAAASAPGRAAAAPPPGGDKLRFVKEIDDALLRGDVDLAVHSAKDVPGHIPAGLEIVAVPVAADPRDALCGAASLDALPEGARVGTASVRRRSQLLASRPDLTIAEVRGNVDTRLRRLDGGEYDAIVLALAGLRRLGRAAEAGAVLDPGAFVPAPGQGALALVACTGAQSRAAAARAIDHPVSRARLEAERALVRRLGATCNTPVGAMGTVDGEAMTLACYVGLPDGSEWIGDRLHGALDEPVALGEELAGRMIAAGAADMLRRAAER